MLLLSAGLNLEALFEIEIPAFKAFTSLAQFFDFVALSLRMIHGEYLHIKQNTGVIAESGVLLSNQSFENI